MLLVDHHETKPVKGDVSLHQRVRADDQVDRAGLDLGQLRTPRRRTGRTGQQGDPETRRLQQLGDAEEVLLGQNLGRRHERDLQAIFHRDQRRQQRDDGLPCPDVALEQAIHRLRPLQVVHDFLERRALARRQLERQHAARGIADPIVHVNHGRPSTSADADRRLAITPS